MTEYQGLGHRIPAKLVPEIGPAHAAAKRTVAPAGPERLAVEMPALFQWARTFGIPFQPNIASAAYRTLADLPGDLLALAIARITAKHTLGMRLPFVAEIRATVQDELDERHQLVHAIGRLAFAVKRGDVETARKRKTPMTAAQKAEFDAQMARLKAGLAAGPGRREPGKADAGAPKIVRSRLPYADGDELPTIEVTDYAVATRPGARTEPVAETGENSAQDGDEGGGVSTPTSPEPIAAVGPKNPPLASDDDLGFLAGAVT